MRTEPAYRALFDAGVLQQRAQEAQRRLADCALCPRGCRVNRFVEATGFCRSGSLPVVCAWHPHFGEEQPLVGSRGSGTIFFGSCNLGCVFCQNWTTSRLIEADEMVPEGLARVMLALERRGCHNINLVTPTHMVPAILAALVIAASAGLSIPLVYNTSGYDSVETLALLDGVVDIYMPDIKFMRAEPAARYAGAPDYPQVVRAAVKEMHRQVGDLALDSEGIAVRGLIVRHLVMPGGLPDAVEVCRFLSTEISKDTYLNLMDQYRPCGEAYRFPEISHPPTRAEYASAAAAAREWGLARLHGARS
ncbi:MAG: radical SAM protein [Vicinamibacterales bacterium]